MSKEESVLEGLMRGERLTVLSCLQKYRITTLTQRVSEWRRQGIPIEDRMVEGAHHKEYWLALPQG